jgi:hypothetical protein
MPYGQYDVCAYDPVGRRYAKTASPLSLTSATAPTAATLTIPTTGTQYSGCP